MANNRGRDNFDDYEMYDDDEFDYDNYDDYDEEFSLTSDDDMPLTSVNTDEYDEPLEKENKKRPQSRRETIRRLSEEQQSGISRKPGVISPDPRIDKLRGMSRNRPASRTPRVQAPKKTSDSRALASANRKKNAFAAFYIAFLLIAISICLVGLFVIIPWVTDRWNNFNNNIVPSPPPHSLADATPRPDLRTLTALIKEIDIVTDNMDTLVLVDIGTGSRREDKYTVSENLILTGRNNRVMIFDELQVGDIVDVRFNALNNEIMTITENSRRWERVNRQGVNISMDERTIVHNNDVWDFNSSTLVLHNGNDFNIDEIRPFDSVTLGGLGSTVWFVRVETSHGFLQLHNMDRVTNGSIMVGSDQHINFDTLEEGEDIILPEGLHHIYIDGDNIEPFVQNIRISQGQTERIDLIEETELLIAQLFLIVTPDNAQIFINGEEHINDAPAEVEFGEVLIRVELDGYHPIQQEFEAFSEIVTLSLELEEIVVEEPGKVLEISTHPTGAMVYINNEFVGIAPVTHRVPVGTHSVVARSAGHESATFPIPVTGNEPEEVIRRTLMLMPITTDPFANQTPVPVATIPPHLFPTLPTIAPSTPIPQITPEPNPFLPQPTIPTQENPFPAETPAPTLDQWWIRPEYE